MKANKQSILIRDGSSERKEPVHGGKDLFIYAVYIYCCRNLSEVVLVRST